MTDPQTEPIKVIKTVLSRLPLYYNFLLEKRKENYKYIGACILEGILYGTFFFCI